MKLCTKCKVEKELSEFAIRNKEKNHIDSWCKECRKINVRDYKRRKSLTYVEPRIPKKNRISKKERKREHYLNNKEKYREYGRLYRLTDKGKAVKRNSENKRRLLKDNGDLSTDDLLMLINSSTKCYWCDCKLSKDKSMVHIDHYVPLSKGGEHTLGNLVASCPTCNMRKSAKDPLEFANEIGKLL